MKKILIGIFFLGFTTLMYPQAAFEPDSFSTKVEALTSTNASYINTVFEADMSKRIDYLESQVAEYNIKEDPAYKAGTEFYSVTFKEAKAYKGTIMATYDANGKIVRTTERFKNVKLPFEVRNTITKTHYGFIIQSNVYVVNYSDKGVSKKFYKLNIARNGETKSLKIDPQGNII
ncbi:hypothetical protein [Mariniflexile sp. AS56]|uniref:hypothetical protein n=1 Tax=Mariniflexile sp. AS56 TaxID=3063957 RepID=UPI0026EDF181|nr:hypothetical protein [Mariniflexile sp. AS56]MDO7172598.1 hypothetical protein [Mariniflexile sp. AS56]